MYWVLHAQYHQRPAGGDCGEARGRNGLPVQGRQNLGKHQLWGADGAGPAGVGVALRGGDATGGPGGTLAGQPPGMVRNLPGHYWPWRHRGTGRRQVAAPGGPAYPE